MLPPGHLQNAGVSQAGTLGALISGCQGRGAGRLGTIYVLLVDGEKRTFLFSRQVWKCEVTLHLPIYVAVLAEDCSAFPPIRSPRHLAWSGAHVRFLPGRERPSSGSCPKSMQ